MANYFVSGAAPLRRRREPELPMRRRRTVGRRTTFLPGLLESTQVHLLSVYAIDAFYIPRDTGKTLSKSLESLLKT